MKKKIFVLFAIFVLMNLGQGCKPEHYLIIDIGFNAAMIRENNNNKQRIKYECTSSIKDRLVFIISHKTEFISAYIPNIGNVCYAYTPARVNDNQLLRNTFSITFDKDFTYSGNTIPAMTNIFEVYEITTEIDEYENYYYNYICDENRADLVLDFSNKFFRNSVFNTTEEYAVTFSCKTSDEKYFEKTILIKFEN